MKFYSLLTGSYERLSVTFSLHRKSAHYIVMIYMPSLILVLLGALLFWLPLTALAERAFFGTFLLLCMTVVLVSSQYGTPQVLSLYYSVYRLLEFILQFL